MTSLSESTLSGYVAQLLIGAFVTCSIILISHIIDLSARFFTYDKPFAQALGDVQSKISLPAARRYSSLVLQGSTKIVFGFSSKICFKNFESLGWSTLLNVSYYDKVQLLGKIILTYVRVLNRNLYM